MERRVAPNRLITTVVAVEKKNNLMNRVERALQIEEFFFLQMSTLNPDTGNTLPHIEKKLQGKLLSTL